jgi:amino acid permease
MSKEFKAVSTLVAGTIGVGFLALPYALMQFGLVGGIGMLILCALLILATNLSYADIVTADKGNHQLPGYARKYVSKQAGYFVTLINVVGNIGVLLAYALLSGTALHGILAFFHIYLSINFLGLIFIIIALFVLKYGMQVIARISTVSILCLVGAIIVLVLVALPKVSLSNIPSLNIKSFSLIFGVSIFAQSGAGSIPMIDELIGYEKKKYRHTVFLSSLIVLIVYIVFGVTMVLAYGNKITSSFIDSFSNGKWLIPFFFSLVTLFATFKSFVLIANNIKEIFVYDYKVPKRLTIFGILSLLIILLICEIFNFSTIISFVGRYSLAIESLCIFAIWFKLNWKTKISYKILIFIAGLTLIFGMVL